MPCEQKKVWRSGLVIKLSNYEREREREGVRARERGGGREGGREREGDRLSLITQLTHFSSDTISECP